MNLRRITQAGDPDFKALTALYTEAFPAEERRETAQLGRMLEEEPRMHFHVVEIGGKRAGLFVYWDFGTFYYLEHLAVYPEMRNQKIGQQVLDWMREHLDGLRILEAEPAETDITTRRVRYYERNGYRILDKEYRQPSYRPGGEGCALWVMGNRTEEGLAEKLETIRQAVYERQ